MYKFISVVLLLLTACNEPQSTNKNTMTADTAESSAIAEKTITSDKGQKAQQWLCNAITSYFADTDLYALDEKMQKMGQYQNRGTSPIV